MKTFACLIVAVMASLVGAYDLFHVDAIPGIDRPLPRVPVPGYEQAGPLGPPYGPSRPGYDCPHSCPLNWDPVVAFCRPGGRTVFVNYCAFQRENCYLNRKCVLYNPKQDDHSEGWL